MKETNKKTNTVAAARALVKKDAEVLTPVVEASDNDILSQVKSDMQAADLGDFCRLRAGLGLENFRELNAAGNWEERMMQMFPERTPRTLRRYMSNGRKFLDAVGVDAKTAYEKLMTLSADDVRGLIAARSEGAKALPEKGVAKQIAIANRITNAVAAYSAGEKPAAAEAKPKAISKQDEINARNLFALGLSRKVRDWGEDAKLVRTMATETLETVQAELTLVVGILKAELRSREANGVK